MYLAESLSLAALEVLVHLENSKILEKFLAAEARFDLSLADHVDPSELPNDWSSDPAPDYLAHIGDVWVDSEHSAVLRVPSAVIPIESIYLLNPAHENFPQIEIAEPQPFWFDPRLIKGKDPPEDP